MKNVLRTLAIAGVVFAGLGNVATARPLEFSVATQIESQLTNGISPFLYSKDPVWNNRVGVKFDPGFVAISGFAGQTSQLGDSGTSVKTGNQDYYGAGVEGLGFAYANIEHVKIRDGVGDMDRTTCGVHYDFGGFVPFIQTTHQTAGVGTRSFAGDIVSGGISFKKTLTQKTDLFGGATVYQDKLGYNHAPNFTGYQFNAGLKYKISEVVALSATTEYLGHSNLGTAENNMNYATPTAGKAYASGLGYSIGLSATF